MDFGSHVVSRGQETEYVIAHSIKSHNYTVEDGVEETKFTVTDSVWNDQGVVVEEVDDKMADHVEGGKYTFTNCGEGATGGFVQDGQYMLVDLVKDDNMQAHLGKYVKSTVAYCAGDDDVMTDFEEGCISTLEG